MTRGFTTNDPAEVPTHVGKGVVTIIDQSRDALLTQLRMRDEAIDDLRNQLGVKRAECDRWIEYNNRLAARLERVREALK